MFFKEKVTDACMANGQMHAQQTHCHDNSSLGLQPVELGKIKQEGHDGPGLLT